MLNSLLAGIVSLIITWSNGTQTNIPDPGAPGARTLCTVITATTSTTSTTVSTSTTTTVMRSTWAGGYIGTYDPATVNAWPTKPSMNILQGEALAQGPIVVSARVAAKANGNNPKFLFYLSFSDLDSMSNNFEQQLHDSILRDHPEWFLCDASGNRVSTQNGIGRVFAMDIGNSAYVDGWLSWAINGAMLKYGWDGIWADNIIRCIDPPFSWSGWSALPINPRTHAVYACADYRQDMVNALARMRSQLHPIAKILIGNHSGAWHGTTFADPKIKQQIALMDGVRLEDCAYDYNGKPHTETEWIQQLQYLLYANSLHVLTQCEGASGTIQSSPSRDMVLATSLLAKGDNASGVAEINSVATYWNGLDIDLGSPLSGLECLDGNGNIIVGGCPGASGYTYRRRWKRGTVVVNPISGVSRTIPLGMATSSCGSAITLSGPSGRVCPQ